MTILKGIFSFYFPYYFKCVKFYIYFTNYSCANDAKLEKTGFPVEFVGSQERKTQADDDYDPYEHRKVEHPLT